jgi:hypothetical protein
MLFTRQPPPGNVGSCQLFERFFERLASAVSLLAVLVDLMLKLILIFVLKVVSLLVRKADAPEIELADVEPA